MKFPGASLEMHCMTEKDEEDIKDFALKKDVDFICHSFIRRAQDIDIIRECLGPNGAHIKVIAKINSHESLQNFDEILAAADGVIIARQDLSDEIPLEKVYIAQKWMTEKANLCAKPAIVC